MDKLPEPEFQRDANWPRKLLGVEEGLESQHQKAKLWFLGLSGASVYRYWREITFYRKNYLTFAIIAPMFVFTSWVIAQKQKVDPYYVAAQMNNQREEEYIAKYRQLYLEAKRKNIEIPDHLIL